MLSSNPQQAFTFSSLLLTILAVLLGSFNNLPSLKADFQDLPVVNGMWDSSKDTLPYHLANHLQDKKKAQLSNHSSNQLSFFQKRAEGWHWYQSLSDNKIKESKTEEEKKGYGLSPSSAQTPTEKIEAQRKQLEKKLHTAILEPSQHNIITYILAQKALMDQSQKFSEAWKQVVLTVPSLDETLLHPVDQNARHVYYTERNKELTSRIKALAQDYGLFFFFRNNCPYCHHFAPIVKHFAEKYVWSVLAISLDGGTLPEFPHARHNNGIAERLHVSHVPALIALHPQSGQIIPLAYGLVSESEIEERVDLLTRIHSSEEVKK